MRVSAKPGKHSKTKHIDNKYYMVRRNVELKQLTVKHCGTDDMVADIMTKALGAVKFARFRKLMKVLPVVTADNNIADATAAEAASTTTTTALKSDQVEDAVEV